VGGFPKASERFGWASDGNDLPAGSLEGVLRLGKRLRLSRHGSGAALDIERPHRPARLLVFVANPY
jgi:hypothetical protein